jgi:hypothetical protein
VSPDPLLAALPNLDLHVGDALNLYGYADANPVKHTDPSGYTPLCVAAAVLGAACVILGFGSAAPSDTKSAPADLGGMLSSVPGPAVVAKATEGVLARIAEASAPRLAGFIRAFISVEAKAGIAAAKAEAAAPAAQALKTGAEGAAKEVEATVAQKAAGAGQGAKVSNAAAPEAVHGNAKASTIPQHRYEISDKSGDVVKTGISGQPLNKDGTSPRANRQVNQLNKSEGEGSYSATVKESNMPGRKAALDAEQAATNRLHREGNTLRLQKRPKPE